MNKNIFNWMLMATVVLGLSMGISSCSDDEDNNVNPSGGQELGEEPRVTFWNVVSQLTDPDDYTADYENKTFEPTIGESDATNPLVRIVAVNDMASAAKRFAQLVDANVDENTQSYEYKNDAVGTLAYTKTNDGRSLATVDVNIKQLPKLQQIRFVNPKENDENGLFSFSGTAYYRFGDVIKRTNTDGKPEYWVCVRPCFSKEDKGNSHWATVSPLPSKNVWAYNASTGVKYQLPTGLGKSTEHMQNLAELLYAMMAPHDWYFNLTENSKHPDFFNDFKLTNIQYHNQWFFNKVYEAWDQTRDGKTLFQLVFNVEDVELWKQMSGSGLKLLHSGYSWWTKTSWNANLYQARYHNGVNASANMHSEELTKPEHNMKDIAFDINELYNEKTMPLRNPDFFGDSDPRWIVRFAKGKELASNGKEKEQEALAGCEEVYRYNKYYYTETIDLKKTEPVITNSGKSRSNVGKIVDLEGHLYNTISDCTANHGSPVAMVIYDTKEMDVDDKANGNVILHRFMDQNLLCISLLSTKGDGLTWGSEGNCGVKRFDIDSPGEFANMVRDINGWLNTRTLKDETGHDHPAAKVVWNNYWGDIHPWLGGFTNSNTSDWVTEWFIPSPAEWRLFLKGMHAWVCSYNGKQVTEHIQKIYEQAGIQTDQKVNINGELYDSKLVIPTDGNFWTSADASNSQAYTMHIDEQYGARFEKNNKSNAYRIFPFVIMRERYK